MKILDRYIIKSFLTGYAISFAVLIGLRVVLDLFVNLDEFAEASDMGVLVVLRNILTYYGQQSTIYFRDFAGMITVVAAVFSLGKMTRNNELTAVMASGVSLKRVIAPIVLVAIGLTGLLVIDQEVLIPSMAHKLVRKHDDMNVSKLYDFWFLNEKDPADSSREILCSAVAFDEKENKMTEPIFFLRKMGDDELMRTEGAIRADQAIYAGDNTWSLVNGYFTRIDNDLTTIDKQHKPVPVKTFPLALKPEDIPVRRQTKNLPLLSSVQLRALAEQENKPRNMIQLYAQKHSRITDPIINLIMLLVALPVLVCRDFKAMKMAIVLSFATTAGCFLMTFGCKMVATEHLLDPAVWSWLPIIVFFPIALLELDSMKT